MKGTNYMVQEARAVRRGRGDGGFTLIELLVVIAIIGILVGIVVFAVGGIGDKGQSSACSSDLRTMQTAEEAYYAGNSTYGTEAQLAASRDIAGQSPYHDVTANSATGYTLTGVGSCVGSNFTSG